VTIWDIARPRREIEFIDYAKNRKKKNKKQK
jgi:hypothetical protein